MLLSVQLQPIQAALVRTSFTMSCNTSVVMVVLMMLSVLLVHGKKYDLSKGWQVTDNNKLQEFEAAQGMGHYRLIQVPGDGGDLLLSDNGTFGLSFFNYNDTGDYYLALVMGTSYNTNASSSGVCVWSANRNEPITENGTLRVTNNGTIQLVDSKGKLAWSSPPGSEIELQESGNMLLYNTTGGIVWQSFDEPTDVLLEGQKMFSGQRLVSNLNSSTLAAGNFEIVVEPSGIIFFLNIPPATPQPYLVWNLWNGNLPTDVTSASMVCPSFETMLQYTFGLVTLSYQQNRNGVAPGPNRSPCGPRLSAAVVGGTAQSLHYIKLDPTGNFVQYRYDPQKSLWKADEPFMRNRLGSCLPMTCGPYSICAGDAQCSCMQQGTNSSSSMKSCPAPSTLPLTCNKLEAENHHFLNVSGASYFSNHYNKADKLSTLNDCWSMCLSNCSCSAFFYNNKTGSCYFVDRIYGSLTADSDSNGFLKVQNMKLVLPKRYDSHASAIASGLAGGAVFFLGIALTTFWIWRKKMNKIADTLAAALQGSIHRFSYKELSLATGNFSTMLGKGGSGSVYEGALSDGRKVAIKRLESTNQGQKEFIAEVNSMGSISHVNIVNLLGFCAEMTHRMLVYEYVPNGSLNKWLFGDRGLCLDWENRFNIALGMARGLAYLHEESRQLIMHLDIKPENILLDEHFVAKVSDFGMSKLLMNRDVSQTVTSVRGTPGYLAPEWLLHSVATRKCDVYSYGMVLLELIGGRRNLDPTPKAADAAASAAGDGAWYFPTWVVEQIREGKIMEILDPRVRENASHEEAQRLIHVALWCIQENPALRLSMDTVVQILEGRREVVEPPLSFHFALQSPGIINISSDGMSITMSSTTLSAR